MTLVVTFNYTCTLRNITKYYNELIQVSSELSVSDMFNVICLVQILSYARFFDRIDDGSIVKKKRTIFLQVFHGLHRTREEEWRIVTRRHRHFTPDHEFHQGRANTPLREEMSFSAEKHLFQGLMGSCPSPPKNREILDGIFEFEVFFFFIIQDNTVERDVRFSKYLKFVISEISISKSALCRRCVWKRKKGEILIYFFNWKGYDYS